MKYISLIGTIGGFIALGGALYLGYNYLQYQNNNLGYTSFADYMSNT